MNNWYPENEKSLDNALVQLCYERIASSVPQGINTKEALRAGIRFVADCIHQIDQSDDNIVMEASVGLLKAEFGVFQKIFKKIEYIMIHTAIEIVIISYGIIALIFIVIGLYKVYR